MVQLYERDVKTNNRNSSKGNQLKWRRNGIWYKADYTGYEGLAEYMISKLLRYSDLDMTEYVDYETEMISYGTTEYTGCKSRNFLPENWQLILEFPQSYLPEARSTALSIHNFKKMPKI